jgi:Family of unknown function (DUF5763)
LRPIGAPLVDNAPVGQNQTNMPSDHELGEPPASEAWRFGPCRYLGPEGQRCDRPAGEDGFCTRHSPEQAGARRRKATQIAAAILLALGLLWPLFHDFLRELSGWIKR